jgi:hypothetical protein
MCGGLWFANGKFGVTWKLYQGVVKPAQSLPKGQCHIKLDDQPPLKVDVTLTEPTYDSDGESAPPSQPQTEPENVVVEEASIPVKKEKVSKKKP